MAKKTGSKIQDQQSSSSIGAPLSGTLGTGNGGNGGNGGDRSERSDRPERAEMSTMGDSNLSNDEIAQRAYEIYEREGRSDGRAMDHWLQAENELRSERRAGKPNQSDLPRSARRYQGESAGA